MMDAVINFFKDFVEIWNSGGILMWPLLFAAIFIYYSAFDMFSRLSHDALPEDIDLMVSDIIGDKPDVDVMLNRFAAVKAEYLPHIDRRLELLTILTGITPLLGLLGTVMGMLTTFSQMNESSTQTIDLMAGGISEALITTQMGLVIAVPALFMIMLIQDKRSKLSLFFQQLESRCFYKISSSTAGQGVRI
jgi:biopolymer transport protein ExbB